MKRKCNLELRLVTPSVFSHSSDHHYNDRSYHSMLDMKCHESPIEKQQLTIFYNGKVASCDATQLQAQTIIYLASKEMEEKSNNWAGSNSNPCSPPSLQSPTNNLSMKRSLQRFLEKRKSRAQSVSPYPITKHHNGKKL